MSSNSINYSMFLRTARAGRMQNKKKNNLYNKNFETIHIMYIFGANTEINLHHLHEYLVL